MFKKSTALAIVFVAGMGLALTQAACSQGGTGGLVPIISQGGSGGTIGTLLGGGLGTPCDILAPNAGPSQGIYNSEALECRSRLCAKPSVQPGVVGTVSTTAYCTELCVEDSDCVGQTRDPNNPLDTRCQTGFVCGIEFDIGPICCKKLCICKDFIAPSGLEAHESCLGDAGASCY